MKNPTYIKDLIYYHQNLLLMIRNAFRKYVWIVCVLLIISCNNSQVSNHETQVVSEHNFNQTKINWIGLWQQRESKRNLLYSVIRKFEVEHQNLEVNFKFKEEFVEEAEGYNYVVEDSMISMMQSGNFAWDIVVLTRNSYKVVADKIGDPEWGKKYLVNFEELDWFRERHIDKIFKVDDYRAGFGGIIAGPMIEGHNYGLWYNVKTAEKLGITIKQKGMTFDDFMGYCKRVEEYNKTALDTITFMPEYKVNSQIIDIFNSLVLSEVGTLGDELPNPSVVKHALMKGLSALEAISAYRPINTDVVVDHEVAQSLNGQVLFVEKPSYWYNKCETEDKVKALDMVPAELPVFEHAAPIYPGTYQSVWAVFKDGPHKDEAIEIMKYFSTNDVAERWLSTTYNPTGLKVNLDASDFGQNEIEKFNTHIEKKYGDNLKSFNLGELLYGKSGIKIEPRKVFSGDLTAEEFYKEIKSQL